MHFIEYDDRGVGIEHEIAFEPDTYYDTETAKVELTTKWGASETGAKENPDNAHGLFLIFWARPWEPASRRLVTVTEIGGFWRRGAGIRLGGRVVGLWVPWRRPPRPVLDTPERVDVSPAELLGAA